MPDSLQEWVDLYKRTFPKFNERSTPTADELFEVKTWAYRLEQKLTTPHWKPTPGLPYMVLQRIEDPSTIPRQIFERFKKDMQFGNPLWGKQLGIDVHSLKYR